MSEWFSPRTSQCIYYLTDGTIKPLPFGPPQKGLYHDIDHCTNPVEIGFLVLIALSMLINAIYSCVLFYELLRDRETMTLT